MEKIVIGEVLKSKGLKGELKTRFFIDAEAAKQIKTIFIAGKKYTIESSYISGGFWFIKPEEINTIDEAEQLKDYDIETDRKELGDGLLTIDLIDKEVILEDGTAVGVLTDITYIAKTETLEIDGGVFMLPNTEDLIAAVRDKIVLSSKRFKELTEYDE